MTQVQAIVWEMRANYELGKKWQKGQNVIENLPYLWNKWKFKWNKMLQKDVLSFCILWCIDNILWFFGVLISYCNDIWFWPCYLNILSTIEKNKQWIQAACLDICTILCNTDRNKTVPQRATHLANIDVSEKDPWKVYCWHFQREQQVGPYSHIDLIKRTKNMKPIQKYIYIPI